MQWVEIARNYHKRLLMRRKGSGYTAHAIFKGKPSTEYTYYVILLHVLQLSEIVLNVMKICF